MLKSCTFLFLKKEHKTSIIQPTIKQYYILSTNGLTSNNE